MNLASQTKPLLQPLKLGAVELPNRIIMAPLTRSRAGRERMPNELMGTYYAQRARAGLIIAEATTISTQGNGWIDAPGIYTQAQANAWSQVVRRVHAASGRIFLQLWHMGRASHSSFHHGALPVAPSALAIQGKEIRTLDGPKPHETPRALELEEIPGVIESYVLAAKRARDAGFDGVEIHAANGYLLDQFLQSTSNHRSDAYGRDIQGRCRLLQEVTEGVVQAFGPGRVGVRLAPNGAFNDMGSKDGTQQFRAAAKMLNDYPLAYLHIMDGLAFGFHELAPAMTLQDFREQFSGVLIGNCGYTLQSAELAVRETHADAVAFGRPFISNPDLVDRYEHDHPLAAWDDDSQWYCPGPEGYTTYPNFTPSP